MAEKPLKDAKYLPKDQKIDKYLDKLEEII